MYATNTSVWIAFGLYLAATFYFAYLAHRKTARANFLEDFFVAGRDIGPWVLALTWLATMASGETFVGAPSLAHHYGWPVMLWISGYIVVATTGMGIMGKRIAEIGRRTGALTFPNLLRDRYESKWPNPSRGRLVEPVLGVSCRASSWSFCTRHIWWPNPSRAHASSSPCWVCPTCGREGKPGTEKGDSRVCYHGCCLHSLWRLSRGCLDRLFPGGRHVVRHPAHRLFCY